MLSSVTPPSPSAKTGATAEQISRHIHAPALKERFFIPAGWLSARQIDGQAAVRLPVQQGAPASLPCRPVPHGRPPCTSCTACVKIRMADAFHTQASASPFSWLFSSFRSSSTGWASARPRKSKSTAQPRENTTANPGLYWRRTPATTGRHTLQKSATFQLPCLISQRKQVFDGFKQDTYLADYHHQNYD